ncbi:hypothetical protein [Pseudoalteromonas phenolica]|uniref:hypothetical protein n=1 Tax=Pseudoalteromonas phenolica TaxID=161398 RepID=UPI00385170C2
MKLKLNKKKMKSLSSDKSSMPKEMTPQIGGGTGFCYRTQGCSGTCNDLSVGYCGATGGGQVSDDFGTCNSQKICHLN